MGEDWETKRAATYLDDKLIVFKSRQVVSTTLSQHESSWITGPFNINVAVAIAGAELFLDGTS